MALNSGQWPAIVNMVMKLRSAYIGEFPTKQATIGLSKGNTVHRVTYLVQDPFLEMRTLHTLGPYQYLIPSRGPSRSLTIKI